MLSFFPQTGLNLGVSLYLLLLIQTGPVGGERRGARLYVCFHGLAQGKKNYGKYLKKIPFINSRIIKPHNKATFIHYQKNVMYIKPRTHGLNFVEYQPVQ